jgi:hypothetical protein
MSTPEYHDFNFSIPSPALTPIPPAPKEKRKEEILVVKS